jgi:hypothetical protein
VFGLGLQELIILAIIGLVFLPFWGIFSPPGWAFGIALVWGVLCVAIGMINPESTLGTGQMVVAVISGLIIIGLAFGVRRRSQIAAWSLVAAGLLDAVNRLYNHQSGFLLPAILLVAASRAALFLRKPAAAESKLKK